MFDGNCMKSAITSATLPILFGRRLGIMMISHTRSPWTITLSAIRPSIHMSPSLLSLHLSNPASRLICIFPTSLPLLPSTTFGTSTRTQFRTPNNTSLTPRSAPVHRYPIQPLSSFTPALTPPHQMLSPRRCNPSSGFSSLASAFSRRTLCFCFSFYRPISVLSSRPLSIPASIASVSSIRFYSLSPT